MPISSPSCVPLAVQRYATLSPSATASSKVVWRSGLLRSAGRVILLRGCVWAQPQRDVRRLHGLPHHPHQFVVQRVEVGLLAQLGREGFEGLRCVVLPAVEASVDEALDAASQRVKERRYQEGGDYDCQLGLRPRRFARLESKTYLAGAIGSGIVPGLLLLFPPDWGLLSALSPLPTLLLTSL
jgi:hypothetical protein